MIGQAGVYWPFKTLLQGAGISIQETATSITVSNTGSGVGAGGGDMLKSEYATNGVFGIVDKAVTAENVTGTVAQANLANQVPWTGITGLPSAFAPSPHAPTHLPGGTDVINPAGTANGGLLNKLTGNTTDLVDGTNSCQPIATAIQPGIWGMRLRSTNGIGNPNFSVDQTALGPIAQPSPTPNGVVRSLDRWFYSATGGINAQVNVGQVSPLSPPALIPGTNFKISDYGLRVLLTAQQTLALGSTDSVNFRQRMEGIQLRSIIGDVSSLSILAWTNILGGLRFGVSIVDYNSATNAPTYTLPKLCTIPVANTWTLIQLPNLPVPPSGASFSTAPGGIGGRLFISLAAGSALIAPVADVWQSTTPPAVGYLSPPGIDNFLTKPVNSQLILAFLQWEPGPYCSTLMDLPFDQNLYSCKRYYQKSVNYNSPVVIGSASLANARGQLAYNTVRTNVSFERELLNSGGFARIWWGNIVNQVYVDGVGVQTASGPPYADSKTLGDFTLTVAQAPNYNPPVLFEYDVDTQM